MDQQKAFAGFAQTSLDFLRNVRINNSKAWFEQSRSDYENHLLNPFKYLIEDLRGTMLTIDASFEIRPSVNKSLSRIYRDTRFSKDKSLFRNSMWLTFKRSIKEWRDAPAYFFELTPVSYRYGMGFYSAARETMDRLRRSIDDKPAEFLKAVSFYKSQNLFQLEGEKYKRRLKEGNPEEIADWYERKNFYLVSNCCINDRLFNSTLVDDLTDGFMVLKPLYRYLWKSKFLGEVFK